MFNHLHVHSEYSLLDGMCRIPQLVARAKEFGMDSLAITDHGVMHGAIQFYQEAREAGIKPIIGCEVYVAQGSRTSRGNNDKKYYHLVLLVKNQTGYNNLLHLSSVSHLEGFYYKPRIDKELIAEYHDGLVALSACLGGELPQLILAGMNKEARQAALWYKETFGDFFLEIQRHPITELERVNQELIAIGNELDIPLVATNDTHYINKDDASIHDLLLCIGTNSTVNDEKRVKMPGDFLYFKSGQEMAEQYQDIPEALENTVRIADMCNLELDFGRLHLPEIELPPDKTPFEFLSDLCYNSLPEYYPDPTEEIKERLAYELNVIKETDYANYFLVAWDIISFTREQKILSGVRGSAASSIVLRCLGITVIDPMEHKLVFERFLNVERKELPDIDFDFQDDRRDEVIAYVTKKYGQSHVAQIITFGTLGAKAALRDVGRALGMPYGDVDRVAKLVPLAVGMTLERAMEENVELNTLYASDQSVKKLIDSAKRVEGIARHSSTHAAGVVISQEPLTNYVPLQRAGKGDSEATAMTQFPMEDIARIGLLKMDFLGLSNLTILGRAKEIIARTQGIDIDLNNLPLDDRKTYDLLSSGETTGIFQLEGTGMRRYIKELKPTTFSDIAAMVALYRPGPMEHIPTFIKAKNGLTKVRYPHPALENILKETYGVIVYQEQVLFIVQALAGYSLGQADIFRKAMGKKIVEVMQGQKIDFIAGAKEKGFTEQEADEIFKLIEPFSGYAFNKAHAVSYALIAYQTAYLKANYPKEYITALLVAHSGQPERVASAVAECRRLEIPLLWPDVQTSRETFSIQPDEHQIPAISFGMTTIKNVGEGAVESIVAERDKGGPFKSVEDFCRRCDLSATNKRAMESLIKAGAFDKLGERGTLLHNLPDILSLAQREQRLRETGQTTMFDLWGETTALPLPSLQMETAEVNEREKAVWEKELMGVAYSKRLFDPTRINPNVTLCGDIDSEMKEKKVTVICEVAGVLILTTRKDSKQFVKATVEDISGGVEVTVWPTVYEGTRDLWEAGNLLQLEGQVRLRDADVQLNVNKASLYEIPDVPVTEVAAVVSPPVAAAEPVTAPVIENTSPVSEPPPALSPVAETVIEEKPFESAPVKPCRLIISMKQTDDTEGDLALLTKLNNTIKEFSGEDEVILRFENGNGVKAVKFENIGYCSGLHDRLRELVGEQRVKLETT